MDKTTKAAQLYTYRHLLAWAADGLVIGCQFDAGMVWWEPEELRGYQIFSRNVQSVLGAAHGWGREWPAGGTSSKHSQSQNLSASRGEAPQTPHHGAHRQALLQEMQGWGTQLQPPKGCSAPGTHTQPLLHLHLAARAAFPQGNIVPMDWEEVGAAAAALLLYSALSSVCNYPKHRVIRHNLQSLQLFGIPLYWVIDSIGSRMQQIETAL